MTIDEHAKHLGGLVTNLQSLEFILRIFHNRQPGARPIGFPEGSNIYESQVGQQVPESDLTSYDSLGTLITKYNAVMDEKGVEKLDATIVDLRDALAHGRVSAALPDDHMRLLKFDRPRHGVVRVAFNQEMSEDWFKAQKTRVYAAIKVVQAQIDP